MARPGRALREQLGDEAMSELQGLIDDSGEDWKDDVLALATERFERRLGEEMGAVRVDMAREFAAVRVDMAKEFAAVRGEMAGGFAAVRADLLKWSFLFWIGQFAALSGMIAFLLRTIR